MIFRTKKQKQMQEDFFKFFDFTRDEAGITVQAEIDNQDIARYLNAITMVIQRSLKKSEIENYLSVQMYVSGQKMEVALINDGKKGPHEMLRSLEEEIKRLQEQIDE